MTFTKEQIDILSKYEEAMRTAVKYNWARNITADNGREIHAILKTVEPKTADFYPSCGTCTLNLLKATGRIYFADVEEIRASEPQTLDLAGQKIEVRTKRSRKTATTEE